MDENKKDMRLGVRCRKGKRSPATMDIDFEEAIKEMEGKADAGIYL